MGLPIEDAEVMILDTFKRLDRPASSYTVKRELKDTISKYGNGVFNQAWVNLAYSSRIMLVGYHNSKKLYDIPFNEESAILNIINEV